MKQKKSLGLSVILAILLVFGANSAFAAGTASGTPVTNQATIDFSVGGVGQTGINSNQTSFVVDNKVDLIVTLQDAGYVDVAPSATLRVLRYRVQNDGNTTQDFQVAAVDLVNGLADPFGGTDNAQIAGGTGSFAVYVDTNDDDAFTNLTDTDTHINALAADTHIEVFVVATIPDNTEVSDGDIAGIILTATARTNDGAATLGGALTETLGGDTAGVDIVFGDLTGDTDADGDASYTDTGAYRLVASNISIVKTSTVIRDPFNDGANPKHIPGAFVQYSITISNGAGAGSPAVLSTITDTLNANTAMDPDLIVGATGNPESAAGSGFKIEHTTGRTTASPLYYSTANNGDADHDGSATGGVVDADMSVVLPAVDGYAAGELRAGESVTLTFNVEIQ